MSFIATLPVATNITGQSLTGHNMKLLCTQESDTLTHFFSPLFPGVGYTWNHQGADDAPEDYIIIKNVWVFFPSQIK